MRSEIHSMSLLVWVAVAGAAGGQEGFDPAARAAAVAPFIDEETYAVFHVEPARVDVDFVADLLIGLFPEIPERAVDDGRRLFGKLRSVFLESGFSDLYVVATTADVEGPFGVIPNPQGHDAAPLVAAWLEITEGKGDFNEAARLKEAVVVGNPEKIDRLTKAFYPDARPELAEAFRAAGNTAFQCILTPSADQRRVLEETMPTLPSALGGGPTTILTRGMLWAAVGFNLRREASLRVVVRSQDASSAEAFHEKLLEVAKLVTEPARPPDWLAERLTTGKVKKAVALLIPKVQGDRLVLHLDEAEGRMKALLEAVTPSPE
ncbi:MAG: hypothetical protein ACYTG0_32690 [Planctomycetota bacterium]|jgi:hypothetical protein